MQHLLPFLMQMVKHQHPLDKSVTKTITFFFHQLLYFSVEDLQHRLLDKNLITTTTTTHYSSPFSVYVLPHRYYVRRHFIATAILDGSPMCPQCIYYYCEHKHIHTQTHEGDPISPADMSIEFWVFYSVKWIVFIMDDVRILSYMIHHYIAFRNINTVFEYEHRFTQ